MLVVLYAQTSKGTALGLVEPAKGEPGAFVFPQGGIEEGETPEWAARRELLEELGMKSPIVRASIGKLRHSLPPERWEENGCRGKEFSIVPVEAGTMSVKPANGENRSFAWAFKWTDLLTLIAPARQQKRVIMLRALVQSQIWLPPESDVPPQIWALQQVYAAA